MSLTAPSLSSSAGARSRTTGRVRVAGGELEYDLIQPESSGAKAPLVFLHGWTIDRRMWAEQVSAFPDRAVIVIDRRGCGASTAPPDLAAEVEDVHAVAESLHLNRFVLVGMSQAGQVAAEFALSYPDRLAGLVLQGVRIGPLTATQVADIPLNQYRDHIEAGRLDAMKALWREHALMRPADPERQLAIDAMLADYDGEDLRLPPKPQRMIGDEDLAGLEVPTLIITGELDTPLRKEVAMRLDQVMARSHRVEVKNAGHMCNMCAPEAYNAALRSLLDAL